MKKQTFLTFLLCFIFCSSIFSQEKDNEPLMGYNEILQTFKRKDLSFNDRYKLEYNHLVAEEQLVLSKLLVLYAKQESDKRYAINIYCHIYALNNALNIDMDKNKLYLDTAYTYINQTDNNDALGNINFQLGEYYSRQPDSEEISHEYFYKAIPYFEKSEKSYFYLNFIYYKLSNVYYNREDVESLKNIVRKMLSLNLKGDDRAFFVNIYSVTSDYYSLLKEKDSINAPIYLDSAIFYRKEVIRVYETLKDSILHFRRHSNTMIAGTYIDIAMNLSGGKDRNWVEIMNYLEKGKELIPENRYTILIKYYYSKGTLLGIQKKYQASLNALFEAERILDTVEAFDASDDYYLEIYKKISLCYEHTGNYKRAIEYERKATTLNNKLYNVDRYKAVKELDVKFETAKKELEISRLNEEQQEILYNRALIIGGFVALAIILLLALLYNRFLRLKKEKESLGLSMRINEKEAEYQNLLKESENKQMRHYLDGLEAERDRLAKGLHDNVANRLFMLDQDLKKLKDIPAGIPQQIEQLYTEVRGISHELISPVFQYTTLSEILHNHIQDLNESTSIDFRLKIENEDILENISPDMSHEIYRIVQECTGNITKHSSAKNVQIILRYNNNSIELTIEDNGIGFDPQIKSKGIGIQIIKDRCETLNGTLQIVSEKGRGCKISATIPFTQSIVDE